MKDLEKLMAGKKGSEKMSDREVQAKLDVVQELLQMAQEAMGSRVKNGMDEMQKVSVMAPDKESLLEGLDVAKDVADDPTAVLDEAQPEETDEVPAEVSATEETPIVEEEEEEPSLFGKKSAKLEPKKKKLFSMDDED